MSSFQRRLGFLSALGLLVSLAAQGCGQSESYPSPPAPLKPTIAGVVDHWSPGDATITLSDGRVVDVPDAPAIQRIGTLPSEGDLLLAGTTAPKFVDVLRPIESGDPGCWEAWQGAGDNPIVWDMGASILFPSGLELPKADGFASDVATQIVDGRQAWTYKVGGINFCANGEGVVEWAKSGS